MNTLDDELLRRLRAELDSLTADVPTAPPILVTAVGRTRVMHHPRRDRRIVVVLAAAMVVLLAGVIGLITMRRDRGAVGTPETAPSNAPVVTYSRESGVVHPTAPSPAGWDLVDWGNVRLSLPAELSPFRPENGCVVTTTDTDLGVVCGNQSVHIAPAQPNVATDQLVNGMRASWQAGDCVGCQTLVLPELTSTVTVQRHNDADANSVLDTVGPSGSWRFGGELRPDAPADWKTVTFEGWRIRVPPGWPVENVSSTGDTACSHELIAGTVLLDGGQPGECDDPSLLAPTDGVRMYLATPPLRVKQGWPQQLIGGGTGGDTPMIVLRVGYGVDPNIGLSILTSFTDQRTSSDTLPTYATVPLPGLAYLALGDSVMLGAKPVLDASGITTFADIAKGPAWELGQVQLVKSNYRLTHGAVIQLGTNGAVTREQYEAILAEVSDLPRVVVLTVKGSHPWIDGNNEIIRSLPATHSNVVVLDWEARSAEVADHLASDGTHLGDDVAKQFFSDIILEALGIPT